MAVIKKLGWKKILQTDDAHRVEYISNMLDVHWTKPRAQIGSTFFKFVKSKVVNFWIVQTTCYYNELGRHVVALTIPTIRHLKWNMIP